MSTPWERFKQAARLEEPDQVPVALIVDSPWLPGYAGIDTRDYYLFPDKWLEINLGLLDRFPGAVWIPGFWVEYGMAAEPSAFGAKVHFLRRPASVRRAAVVDRSGLLGGGQAGQPPRRRLDAFGASPLRADGRALAQPKDWASGWSRPAGR